MSAEIKGVEDDFGVDGYGVADESFDYGNGPEDGTWGQGASKRIMHVPNGSISALYSSRVLTLHEWDMTRVNWTSTQSSHCRQPDNVK